MSDSLLNMPGLTSSLDAKYLTPEMAQRLANVAYAPEEQGGLQDQLAQAIALRNGQERHHESSKAALYDGIGDIARNIGSFGQENKIRGQQTNLLNSQKSAYGDYMKQLAAALRGGQPQPQPQDPSASGGML